MGRIIDEIDDESHIIADITYGLKDLPIIIFSALGFAERFLGCEIDAIIYGQANFVSGHVVNTKKSRLPNYTVFLCLWEWKKAVIFIRNGKPVSGRNIT